MKVTAVCVGLPRPALWDGQVVVSGIFKQPVHGAIPVRGVNLEGDQQADLSAHGGPEKAVYAYPEEHYPYWRQALVGKVLSPGAFGENLTTRGLREEEVWVGDRFRVGTAVLTAVQPRIPCYKLAMKMARPDMPRLFTASGRSGIYFSIHQEGEIAAGDPIERLSCETGGITIAEFNHLQMHEEDDLDVMRRALQAPALPQRWRRKIAERLEWLASQ